MSRRTYRIAEAIRRLTSEIVQGQLRDPRIGQLITITKVEVTPDLRLAKIYYSVLGESKKKKITAQGLESAKKFIRKRIGDELKLRYTPDISLRVDKSAEHSEHIDKILDKIHKEEENEAGKKSSEGN